MHVRKSGTGWRVIVQHNGLRRSATARTKEEAKRKGSELRVQMGDARPAITVTVAEMLHSWLDLTATTHKATYHIDAERVINRLPATFGAYPVREVQPLLVHMLYQQLLRDGWTTHRVHRLHQVMRNAWKLVAIPYGYTAHNPIGEVKPPRRPPSEVRAPTGATVRTLLAAATGQISLFLELAARTGARRGELCALQWGDIRGNQLIIRRSIATVPGRPLIIGDTKTGARGQRVVALDPITVAALHEHKAVQSGKAERSKLVPLWIFSHDAGISPWRTDYISREFARLCDRTGVTDVHLHSLRHFTATQLLAAGETATTVAHRLGHSTTATTLKVYADYVLATDQRAADTMDGILGG